MTQSKILDLLNFESIYKTNVILSILSYCLKLRSILVINTKNVKRIKK